MTIETIIALSIPLLFLVVTVYVCGYGGAINKSEKEIKALKDEIRMLHKKINS